MPLTTTGFALMPERAARRGLGLDLKAHPHMLRHACGYALANKGHDTRAMQGWLGHRSMTFHAVCGHFFERHVPLRPADTGGIKDHLQVMAGLANP